jgi:hypothetical protein
VRLTDDHAVGEPRRLPLYPGTFSGAAWALGSAVLVVASQHDPCAGSYGAQNALKAGLFVAIALQATALVIALVRVCLRHPRSGRSLLAIAALSLCAVPAAFVVFLAITGFCLGDLVM